MRAIASPFVPTYRGAHLRSALQATWDKFGFVAPRRSSVVLSKGAGTFSFTRATTATVEDWEGAIRVCKSGEVRFPGARRVENLLATTSEDFTNAAWSKTNCTVAAGAVDPLGGTSAYEVTVTGSAAIQNLGSAVVGRTYRNSIWMRRISGTGQIGLRDPNGTNVDLTALLADGAWKRVTTDATVANSTSARCTPYMLASGDKIAVWRGMVEEVTGQSNQNPSEYVSVGVLSSPFHGAMVDGVRCFEHQNGNTVASNVVTEATGATLTTCKGQLDETASTNLVLQSSNFGTTWAAVGSPTRSAAAKYCGSVALDLIGDDDAAVREGYYIDITFTADAAKSISFLVSQGTASSTRVQLYDNTDSITRSRGHITWSAGVPTYTPTTGTQERSPEPLGNGVWRIFVVSTTVTAANTNRLFFWPACSDAADATSTGTIYIGGVQAENATTASSHIPTTTGPVTRNADAGSYPSAGNVSASGGTLYLEYEIERGSDVLQVLAMLSDGPGTDRVVLYRGVGGDLELSMYDGGVHQVGLNLGAAPVGGRGKVAVRLAANDVAAVMTGGSLKLDTSATIPAVTTIYPGQYGNGSTNQAQIPTKNLRISQQLLSNAELLALVA